MRSQRFALLRYLFISHLLFIPTCSISAQNSIPETHYNGTVSRIDHPYTLELRSFRPLQIDHTGKITKAKLTYDLKIENTSPNVTENLEYQNGGFGNQISKIYFPGKKNIGFSRFVFIYQEGRVIVSIVGEVNKSKFRTKETELVFSQGDWDDWMNGTSIRLRIADHEFDKSRNTFLKSARETFLNNSLKVYKRYFSNIFRIMKNYRILHSVQLTDKEFQKGTWSGTFERLTFSGRKSVAHYQVNYGVSTKIP